eukprot:UN10722
MRKSFLERLTFGKFFYSSRSSVT